MAALLPRQTKSQRHHFFDSRYCKSITSHEQKLRLFVHRARARKGLWTREDKSQRCHCRNFHDSARQVSVADPCATGTNKKILKHAALKPSVAPACFSPVLEDHRTKIYKFVTSEVVSSVNLLRGLGEVSYSAQTSACSNAKLKSTYHEFRDSTNSADGRITRERQVEKSFDRVGSDKKATSSHGEGPLDRRPIYSAVAQPRPLASQDELGHLRLQQSPPF